MLHHDNAAPHKAAVVTEYLKEESLTFSPPPYSPDLVLAPCDFYLLPKIKNELSGRSFNSVKNLLLLLLHAIQAIVDSIPREEYYKLFDYDIWQNQLKKCRGKGKVL